MFATSAPASFNVSLYILTMSISTKKLAHANSALELREAIVICVRHSFVFENSLRVRFNHLFGRVLKLISAI